MFAILFAIFNKFNFSLTTPKSCIFLQKQHFVSFLLNKWPLCGPSFSSLYFQNIGGYIELSPKNSNKSHLK